MIYNIFYFIGLKSSLLLLALHCSFYEIEFAEIFLADLALKRINKFFQMVQIDFF